MPSALASAMMPGTVSLQLRELYVIADGAQADAVELRLELLRRAAEQAVDFDVLESQRRNLRQGAGQIGLPSRHAGCKAADRAYRHKNRPPADRLILCLPKEDSESGQQGSLSASHHPRHVRCQSSVSVVGFLGVSASRRRRRAQIVPARRNIAAAQHPQIALDRIEPVVEMEHLTFTVKARPWGGRSWRAPRPGPGSRARCSRPALASRAVRCGSTISS